MHRLSNTAAKLIFTSIAIVLLAISYVFYQQIHFLLLTQDQLNETNVVKFKLEQTLYALKDAESAQNAFLLTKNPIFLQRYHGAYKKVQTHLSEIKDLIKTDKQQKGLVALQAFVELRFKAYNDVIERYNNPTLKPETKQAYLLMSQSEMDSINYYAQNINIREDDLLTAREKAKEKYSFLTPFFAILLMVTAIGILVFAYGKIIEQLNRLRRAFSEMKGLNSELRQKNHKLELYNKELDSFTYIASHDLKEPIRKILTYSSQMEMEAGENLSEDSKKQLNRIQLAAQRMQNLLNDLLLYSHINTSDKTFEKVDLNKIVEAVMYGLNEEIVEAHAHIEKDQLPVIKGMPFQLRQLFENLISNSIKYRQPGVPLRISIGGSVVNEKDIHEQFHKESDHYFKLFIKDNGLGFEQEYAEKVFKLFQRLHFKNNIPGTGIGLTICKKIVDNHNGFIKATSEVNKGTTFEIYLPLD